METKDDLSATFQCSLVTDMPKWKYCRKIGECKPGEHVMCMYHNPGSTMSSNCTGNPIDITMENRQKILSKINKMRSETRNGKVRGRNNILLPKGYELKDLEWDDELARFAQVWANQCNLENGDRCRATGRFPNPGQFVGGIQYTYPNIEDLNVNEVLKRAKGITHERTNDILESILNLVYNMKNYVTRDMILKYVDRGKSDLFLLAVNGGTTHIGCAMSYWVLMNNDETNAGFDFYKTALVCNLSSQPVVGKKVYETSRPNSYQWLQKSSSKESGIRFNQNGDVPSVVIMPIIKPDEELISFDDINKEKQAVIDRHRQKNKHSTVKITDRYFNRKPIVSEQQYLYNKTFEPNNGHTSDMKPAVTKHGSIFTRVAKFELPSQHHDDKHKVIDTDLVIKNRLDNAKKLSKADILRLKELMLGFSTNKQGQTVNLLSKPTTTTNDLTSITYPSATDKDVINFNDAKDDNLFHDIYELVQNNGVGVDEIVNVTQTLIHNNKVSSPYNAKSKYNKRYKDYIGNSAFNQNDEKYQTILSTARLLRKEPHLLELRKQNPLMRYAKNIINYGT